MRFEVLGPVRIASNGRPVGPISALRRRLLAVLLVGANQQVSTDALIEALWGEQLPGNPGKSLHVHIHRLRQVLDSPARLAGSTGGYSLRVGPGELDVETFGQLHAEARAAASAGDLKAAVSGFRTALGMWRGGPYADISETSAVALEARRLTEARLLALEELYDAELGRGAAREVVPELTELVAEFPLRERFTGQLMRALYRSGRQGRALAEYQAIRRRLADRLKIDPGPELRSLSEAIRSEDPDLLHPCRVVGTSVGAAPEQPASGNLDVRVPDQLPPVPGAFVGRTAELAQLAQLTQLAGVDSSRTANPRDQPQALILLTGMAGIGKTGLALCHGHRVRENYPDGTLFLDLRGHSSKPALEPLEALGQLLRGLGVDGSRIPATVAGATAEFRTRVAEKRMLVLLDNAASPEQVRSLLPGSSSVLTLVTSRNRLSGLVAREGAHRLGLGELSVDAARQLLTRLVGRRRTHAEPRAVDDLIKACAGMPLALRIAGAQLVDEPDRGIEAYLAGLRATGLAALALDDDQTAAVGPAFDLSYQRLAPETRRVFRLLGLIPGPDFPLEVAETLRTTPTSRLEEAPRDGLSTRELLRTLCAAHLLEEHAGGRYQLHDLLRDYARFRVERDEPDEAREEALHRLFTWYSHRYQAYARASSGFAALTNGASAPVRIAFETAFALGTAAELHDWESNAIRGLAAGRPEPAIEHGERALAILRDTGHWPGEARAHPGLAAS